MLPGRMKNLPRNQTTRTTSKSIYNSKHFSTIVLNENSFNSPNKNTEVNGLEYVSAILCLKKEKTTHINRKIESMYKNQTNKWKLKQTRIIVLISHNVDFSPKV